jgi:hypothetical protein
VISAPKTRAKQERGDSEAAEGVTTASRRPEDVDAGADLGGELEEESGSSTVRPGSG